MATPPGTIFSRTDPDQWAVTHSLEGVRDACFWLEDVPRRVAYPPLAKATEADLLVVGGGYCGLWTAVVAKQRDPHLRVVLLEAQQVGWAASGRNGGFCAASITHGEENGRSRWPDEYDALERSLLSEGCRDALVLWGDLLVDGHNVRLSGQDSARGTFSHRHAVLFDIEDGKSHVPLQHLSDDQGVFEVFNSPLCEIGVLGFEYGYSLEAPDSLVIWEAQFGDFANGAQVMIDQFIVPSESKWQRMNGLVMLLPHGYEGQGPEHSSARPERYLQMAAQYNIIVANVTEPSNFFHLIRRQLAWPFRKPLIVMSPKSLLRHPKVVSPVSEFTNGNFRELISDDFADPKKVKRVLVCSGKIFYDLKEEQLKNKRKDIAIIRIEQLYPFPDLQLDDTLKTFNNPEVLWVQEEPSNMGYWAFVLRTYNTCNMRIIARKPSASPATGYAKMHEAEQREIVETAFNS